MARLTELPNVDRITAMVRVAKRVSREAGRDWTREIRSVGRPVVADARARFRALGGAKARTVAGTVKFTVAQRRVGFRMSGRAHPWGAPKEFGAKRDSTREMTTRFPSGKTWDGVRRINYSAATMFGPWTGNQAAHTRHLRGEGLPAGKAFHPAFVDHADRLYAQLEGLADRYVEIIANATS